MSGPAPDDASAAAALALHTNARAEALAAVDRQCFSPAWSVADYQGLLQDAGLTGWVLLTGMTPVALLCGRRVAQESELLRIAVLPGWRGKGLARRLLRTWIAHEQALGVAFLHLEVRPSNHSARGLYEAEGFVTAGTRPGYYPDPKEDALIYTLELGDAGSDPRD